MQIFIVEATGETRELGIGGKKPVGDFLDTKEVFIIVDDISHNCFLWKGKDSRIRSKFIGAKKVHDVRGQVGLSFKVEPIDEGEEPEDFKACLKNIPITGYAKEIREGLDSEAQRKEEERLQQLRRAEEEKRREEERLIQLRDVVQVSRRLKVDRLAKVLDMAADDLWKRIFRIAKEFGFEIEEDTIVFEKGNKEGFIADLEREFSKWGAQGETQSRAGKIETSIAPVPTKISREVRCPTCNWLLQYDPQQKLYLCNKCKQYFQE